MGDDDEIRKLRRVRWHCRGALMMARRLGNPRLIALLLEALDRIDRDILAMQEGRPLDKS